MSGVLDDYGSNIGIVKNFATLRVAVLLAGLLSLFQSLIWIGLTIVGILAYTCTLPIAPEFSYGSLVQYVFLSLYFKGNCQPTGYQGFDRTILNSVETVLNTEDILIWDCVYLAVAVCWCIASLLLLFYVRKDDIRSTSLAIYIWIVVVLFINLMDLALGIIFGIDYGKFNRASYKYNLSSLNAGPIDPQAAQLVAGGVAAISMMIVSLKGFVLWLINVGLMFYLMARVTIITDDKDNNDTFFRPRKDSDDVLPNRLPIRAYEGQINSSTPEVYTNNAYMPDTRSMVDIEVNQEPLTRAARMSTDVILQERRFHNIDSFQQYPPMRHKNNNNNNNNNHNNHNNNSIIGNNNKSLTKQESLREEVSVALTPTVIAHFPAPDYTPPTPRGKTTINNGLPRNQR